MGSKVVARKGRPGIGYPWKQVLEQDVPLEEGMSSWFADRLRQAEALLNQADQLASQAKRRSEDRTVSILPSEEKRSVSKEQGSKPWETNARDVEIVKDEGTQAGIDVQEARSKEKYGSESLSTSSSVDRTRTFPRVPSSARSEEERKSFETEDRNEKKKVSESVVRNKAGKERNAFSIPDDAPTAAPETVSVGRIASAPRPTPGATVTESKAKPKVVKTVGSRPTAPPRKAERVVDTSAEDVPSSDDSERPGRVADPTRSMKEREGSTRKQEAPEPSRLENRPISTPGDLKPQAATAEVVPVQGSINAKKFADAALDTLYILGLAESDSEADMEDDTKQTEAGERKKIAEDRMIEVVLKELESLQRRNAQEAEERKLLEESFQTKRAEHLAQVRALQQSIHERTESKNKEKDAAEEERLQAWEKVALLEADRDAMAVELSDLERRSNTALVAQQEAQALCTKLEATCAQLQSEVLSLSSRIETRAKHAKLALQEQSGNIHEEQEREMESLRDTIASLEQKLHDFAAQNPMKRTSGYSVTRDDQELDAQLKHLSNVLIQMQSELESLATEKAALQMGLETSTRMLVELENSLMDTSKVPLYQEQDLESGDSQAKARRRSQLFLRLSSIFGLEYAHHIVTFLASTDQFCLTACNILYHNPAARTGLALYFTGVQVWVLFLFHYLDRYEQSAGNQSVLVAE